MLLRGLGTKGWGRPQRLSRTTRENTAGLENRLVAIPDDISLWRQHAARRGPISGELLMRSAQIV